MIEKIMCSAVWVKDKTLEDVVHKPRNIEYGAVYCAFRHCDCFELVSHKYEKKELVKHGYDSGFLTTENRFVDRTEGMLIASKSGQLTNPQEVGKILFSEDMW